MAGSHKTLGDREVRGMFFHALEEATKRLWVSQVAHEFPSDQAQEIYRFVGQSPALGAWIGQRRAVSLDQQKITVVNRLFEAGIAIKLQDLQRDKTGQLRIRIGDLGKRAATLPQQLISTLLLGGGTAYDGIAFYGDRTGVKTGGQIDNRLVPTAVAPASPTVAEMATALLAAAEALVGTLDDQDQPLNEDATAFTVMVPPNMSAALAGALKNEFVAAGESNTVLAQGAWTFNPIVNARLKSQTAVMHIFRADADVKALIWQEEGPTQLSSKAEGSDYEHDNHAHEYGVVRSGEVAYGEPGMATKNTFTV